MDRTRMIRDDPFDLIGDVLDGQFRIDALAGEGDLSVVYKGHHMGVDAAVAVKCLNLPATLDPALVRPLVEGFKEASRIHYRLARGNLNIAQSIGGGSTLAPRTGAVVPYLVREWFEGESLANELARRREEKKKGRSVDEAISLLDAAFDGVAHAHAQGDVHLSLNPSNLFLSKQGNASSLKVLDFGVAREMNDPVPGVPRKSETRAGLRVLFPAYAAPEQLDKTIGELGPWTDVYALALLTMEVLSDRVVMSEQETGALVEHVLDEGRRPTPEAHGLKIPRDLAAVLARAVARAPGARHQSAAELWKDVKSAARATSSRSVAVAASQSPRPSGLAQPQPAPSMALRPKAATMVGIGTPGPAVVVGAVGHRLKLPSTPSTETQPMSFEPRPPVSEINMATSAPAAAPPPPPPTPPAWTAMPTPTPAPVQEEAAAPPPVAPIAMTPIQPPLDADPELALPVWSPARVASRLFRSASPILLRLRMLLRRLPPVRTLLRRLPPVRTLVRRLPPVTPAVAVGVAAGVTFLAILLALVASLRRPAPQATLASASAETTSSSPPPPPPPAPIPDVPQAAAEPTGHFTTAAATRALDATSRTVAKCRLGKRWGTAMATVTFANDGSVSQVVVGPPFTRTPSGDCVADGLAAAHVKPFAGGSTPMVYRFYIAP
jgi:eukaryotic-like serine/threonine-protein kinase